MDNEPVILAIGRIERALSRIESAKSALITEIDPALEERHETLKSEMRQAIQTIDSLIGRQEN